MKKSFIQRISGADHRPSETADIPKPEIEPLIEKGVVKNLNELGAKDDWGHFSKAKNNSIYDVDGKMSVLFRDHKEELISKIDQYDCIVGCVAWLTDFDILDALSNIELVSIIVQKEDFLRPDVAVFPEWKTKLRFKYNSLKNEILRTELPGLMKRLSICCDPTLEPVRCVGNHNKDKISVSPRMHNKFLVFCDLDKSSLEEEPYIVGIRPQEVWTGSFNFTYNATMSLENVIVISNLEVALAYYKEYCQIFALSESLDWTTDWCEPEYRIGT